MLRPCCLNVILISVPHSFSKEVLDNSDYGNLCLRCDLRAGQDEQRLNRNLGLISIRLFLNFPSEQLGMMV